MRGEWFETVAEAQRRAKRRLPPSVYGAILGGSEKGVSYRDNLESFRELGFAPRLADRPKVVETAVTVLDQSISLPVFISPTGVQGVHPDGEIAVARAAAARGIAMGLSSFASKTMEEVISANPKTFFQLYWMGSRDSIVRRIERARRAGAVGLILTLDWSFAQGRDWGSPFIPERLNWRAFVRLAPEALTHPSWLGSFVRAGRLPDLTTPNLTEATQPAPTFFSAYGEWMMTAPPTWDDVAWVRQQWDGPFMLKGVSRIDDAKRAVDSGFDALSVSNHGGNNLDGTPAPIRVLPAIVDAVGDQIEVLLDGGIRRGGDVIKAVALGAKAVMIGRACLWGLAANGRAGVENVIDIVRGGIESTLRGLGRSSLGDVDESDVVVPPGFTRVLGPS